MAALLMQSNLPDAPPAEGPIETAEALISAPSTEKAPTPAFRPVNFQEDYSSFRDIRDTNMWTRLKYIPLGDDIYASLGGELRLRGEYRGGERYGMIPQDKNGDY